ncbi:hypothetical protein [uncultured Algibacter sp.]|uniref:hypothetical protein n=1 Tax=uncultured Algibacter sp. TaxID=298659 RepID=UPI002616D692|nr:hypothetical protein [uncultured Algibacter sp.]
MKPFFFIACTMLCAFCYGQTVNIPDKNFERILVELGIDTDKEVNGVVLRSDVQTVSFLDLYNKKIKSLKGIEAFVSLTYLDCRNNYLSHLDLSKNIALNTLYSDVNNTEHHRYNNDNENWFDY